MKTSKLHPRSQAGYSLVEVLVASGILALGLSAACIMSLAMTTQEEMNQRMARSMNLHENAAALYQLGMEGADLEALLPAHPNVVFTYAPSPAPANTLPDASMNIAGLGTMPAKVLTATIYTTPPDTSITSGTPAWSGGARGWGLPGPTGNRPSRTVSLTVYRAAAP